MGRNLQTRKGVYELYWTFAARRQAAFVARANGQAAPWSADPILQQYKFCNVFRASDRVSQFLIRHVIYGPEKQTPADLAFQIVAFRTFSNNQTWQGLCQRFGHAPTLADLKSGAFERALAVVKKQNGKLYTGAFILCATNAYGYSEKHKNHAALFADMFLNQNAAHRIQGANSLEQVVAFLQSFPLMGPFMSYQTAIDLNYSELINFSENDYTQAGPGALRGIKKCFESTGSYTPRDVIMWMVENQEREFKKLGLAFEGLDLGSGTPRAIHAIDAQGLFCETDKYCRVAVPDLKSARSRIKSQFAPQAKPIDYFIRPNGR